MGFCPTCKRNHDPDINCTDGTTQLLRDIGIEKTNTSSKEEFKKIEKSANKAVIIVLLIILVGVLIFLFVNK
jgi:hypothetical protein